MIFVDTGFLVALFERRDPDHRRVVEVIQRFKGKSVAKELLTTDLVILETITFLVRKVSHERAVYVGERLVRGQGNRELSAPHRSSLARRLPASLSPLLDPWSQREKRHFVERACDETECLASSRCGYCSGQ